MPANNVLTKSGTMEGYKNEWRTPAAIFALAEQLFGPFNLDVAATTGNHLCPHWLGEGGLHPDALVAAWSLPGGEAVNAWMNPPYSNASTWVIKAFREARLGRASVTCLVNSATEVQWFHRCVFDLRATLRSGQFTLRQGVIFLPLYRRIKFIDPATGKASKGSPPAGSALLHFTRGLEAVNPLHGNLRTVRMVLDGLNGSMAEIDALEAQERAWIAALEGADAEADAQVAD